METISVLLVEDYDPDYALVREMLLGSPHEAALDRSFSLTRVTHFREAMRECAERHVDVVLLDLSLPDSAPEKTLSELRSLADDTAIIVLSGMADLETAMRSVYEGADDYLVKGRFDANLLARSLLYAYERKRREVERKTLQLQMEHVERLKSLGLFSAGIAHDFNNILGVVLANLQLARLNINDPSDAVDRLDKAEKASMLAAGLTNQLLSFSGRGFVKKENLSLSGMIKELQPLLRSLVKDSVKLTYSLAPMTPWVFGDSSQLTQLIINLVVNAAESLQDRAGEVTIQTSAIDMLDVSDSEFAKGSPQENVHLYACLEIRDNGKGMTEETKARLFDPFFSTKGQGRGLGLSAVWSIVQASGGHIQLDSTEGKGTKFRIFIPGSSSSVNTRIAHLEEFDGIAQVCTVLLVDDNEMLRDSTGKLLESFGYRVVSTGSGEEALGLFRNLHTEIGLVILDLGLPDVDGLSLFEQMRTIRKDIPILFASGYAENGIVKERQDQNGVGIGFLQKPFFRDELLNKVRMVTAK